MWHVLSKNTTRYPLIIILSFLAPNFMAWFSHQKVLKSENKKKINFFGMKSSLYVQKFRFVALQIKEVLWKGHFLYILIQMDFEPCWIFKRSYLLFGTTFSQNSFNFEISIEWDSIIISIFGTKFPTSFSHQNFKI